MAQPKILTLIMAGGAGGRMDLLTDVRAKPALPFAGTYRLIDFPLSNCVHSGLSDVWVIEQFQAHTLTDHLANGRAWDLDRTYGGLRIIAPQLGTSEEGWHRGNADAIYRNRRFIREFAPELVLVLSADHLYKLDYGLAIAAHRDRSADLTLVTTQVPREQAARFGNVRVNRLGRVTEFAYKPERPLGETVTTEVFVYSADALLDTIDALVAQQGDERHALSDFGDELLPALVEQGKVYGFALDGYWRDVGTVASYWLAHMELLGAEPPWNLDEPGWPVLTYGAQRLPARIEATARLDAALVSPGALVRGTVERAVLGPGVVVEAGATVRDAVIFENARIDAGAVVERAVVDAGAQIGRDARVGAPSDLMEEGDALSEQIALIGRGARVADGISHGAGARVEPERAGA